MPSSNDRAARQRQARGRPKTQRRVEVIPDRRNEPVLRRLARVALAAAGLTQTIEKKSDQGEETPDG